jgi:hypothetical protein
LSQYPPFSTHTQFSLVQMPSWSHGSNILLSSSKEGERRREEARRGKREDKERRGERIGEGSRGEKMAEERSWEEITDNKRTARRSGKDRK